MRAAALQLERLHDEIAGEWWTRLTELRDAAGSNPSVAVAFPAPRLQEWETTLERLIDAMRDDVAPAQPGGMRRWQIAGTTDHA